MKIRYNYWPPTSQSSFSSEVWTAYWYFCEGSGHDWSKAFSTQPSYPQLRSLEGNIGTSVKVLDMTGLKLSALNQVKVVRPLLLQRIGVEFRSCQVVEEMSFWRLMMH